MAIAHVSPAPLSSSSSSSQLEAPFLTAALSLLITIPGLPLPSSFLHTFRCLRHGPSSTSSSPPPLSSSSSSSKSASPLESPFHRGTRPFSSLPLHFRTCRCHHHCISFVSLSAASPLSVIDIFIASGPAAVIVVVSCHRRRRPLRLDHSLCLAQLVALAAVINVIIITATSAAAAAAAAAASGASIAAAAAVPHRRSHHSQILCRRLVRQLLTHLTLNPVEPYQISTRKSLTVGLQMLQKMLKYCNARCNLGFGGVANIRQKEARYVKE